MDCTNCTDANCKTCEAASQCGQCILGYDLNPTTFACSLNSHFYLSSGNVIACDATIGCDTCTDATSCLTCLTGFYWTGSACNACSVLVADCILCDTTDCYECLGPKVLINGSLCADPLSPQVLPGPNSPVGSCTDSNCLECDQNDRSLCLLCRSSLILLVNGRCLTVCGDGLIDGTDVCDDGNQDDFDGCSADCSKIEDGFACNLVPSKLAGFDTS